MNTSMKIVGIVFLFAFGFAFAQLPHVGIATNIQQPLDYVALPQAAYVIEMEACLNHLEGAHSGLEQLRNMAEERPSPTTMCYLLPAESALIPSLIFSVTRSFRTQNYELFLESSDDGLLYQHWRDERPYFETIYILYDFTQEEGLLMFASRETDSR